MAAEAEAAREARAKVSERALSELTTSDDPGRGRGRGRGRINDRAAKSGAKTGLERKKGIVICELSWCGTVAPCRHTSYVREV